MQDGGLSLLLAFLDPEFLISNTLGDSNNQYEKQKGSIAWSAVCPLIRPPSPIALSSKREVHGYLSVKPLSLSPPPLMSLSDVLTLCPKSTKI